VEGTAVYGADGNKIGSIERVMIQKVGGKVAYAVLGFGGFLGIGDDHDPLPWESLTYNTELGGYQVAITNDQLANAPRYGSNDSWDWEDRSRVPPSMTTMGRHLQSIKLDPHRGGASG
jgi:hypothetical protein